MRDQTVYHLSPLPSMAEHQERELTQAILQALRGLRFGSVEIIIHDTQVVQIERKEKIRFDKTSATKAR